VNPALEEFSARTPISVTVDEATCQFHLFVGPWSTFSDCDKARDFMTKQGLSFTSAAGAAGSAPVVKIGATEINGYNEAAMKDALKAQGYPDKADPSKVNYVMTLLILFVFLIYVTMVYGPIAAFLVELFPTRIRYTSMSLPYHIGNGWFGGMLPLTATAVVALYGNIYAGLWYPVLVSVMTVVIGAIFLRETKERDITTYEHES